MIRAFASRQFLAFLLTGGTAAAVNFGSRILYNHWCSFSTAVLLAYLTGMAVAFGLNKLFVFTDSQQQLPHAAMRFTIVNIAGFAQTWLVTMALCDYALPAMGVTRFAAEIGHGIGIAVPVFSSYLGHKYWSFR